MKIQHPYFLLRLDLWAYFCQVYCTSQCCKACVQSVAKVFVLTCCSRSRTVPGPGGRATCARCTARHSVCKACVSEVLQKYMGLSCCSRSRTVPRPLLPGVLRVTSVSSVAKLVCPKCCKSVWDYVQEHVAVGAVQSSGPFFARWSALYNVAKRECPKCCKSVFVYVQYVNMLRSELYNARSHFCQV